MSADMLAALAAELPALPRSVLAGISGGADSVALLRLLALTPCRVYAVHVNHSLRGDASDGDEAFVQTLCEQLHIPLLIYRAQPPANPSEDWARRARYGFFRQAMRETSADALVLAHHRDDQAETLLLHLLRGAGLTGLCGMAADTVSDGMRILRPLLGFTRAQLRHALTEAGQPWREDASNADPRYLRNAVRLRLLPLMEELAPGASGRIAATAGLLRTEEDALAQQTAALLAPYAGLPYLPLALLDQAPPLRARLLRSWWSASQAERSDEYALSREQTEALTALVAVGQQCNLPCGWHAYRGWQYLHLLPPQSEPCNTAPVPYDHGATLGDYQLVETPTQGSPGNGWQAQELSPALLAGCEVRFRQTGDWIRPFGSAGRQSLQDYLVNRRVDAPFRDRIPLLCQGSEVLLVCGVGAGSVGAWTPESKTVRLIWQGPMPWHRR